MAMKMMKRGGGSGGKKMGLGGLLKGL